MVELHGLRRLGGWGDDSAVAVLDMSSSLISGRSRLIGGLTTGGGWEEGEQSP